MDDGQSLPVRLLLLLQLTTLVAGVRLPLAQSPRRRLGDVCISGSPDFSFSECHLATVGVSDPSRLLLPAPPLSLRRRGERGPAQVPRAEHGAPHCPRRFHVLSTAEAEQLEGDLGKCLLSTWAAYLHHHLASSLCAEASPADADIVVLPGYTAVECNWPVYGGGDCHKVNNSVANAAREGMICRGSLTLRAFRRIQQALGRPVVVLEFSPNPFGNKYDLPNRSFYSEANVSLALVGTDAAHYRRGTDISVPPGPSLRCSLDWSGSRVAASFDEPLENKTFLASFKGRLEKHSIRMEARRYLHDGQQVIIAGQREAQWDFEDLLFSSVFSLILRGDDMMSFRFNEAVCSGGIPVLVTDFWIPPFNETVAFETFGLIHNETDINNLTGRLESIGARQRSRLRKAARKACEQNFQTIDTHASTLAQAISQLRIAV